MSRTDHRLGDNYKINHPNQKVIMEDIFESSVRSTGDVAGVFEFDGEAGYFYLYRLDAEVGNKVLGAIHISSKSPDYRADDIDIVWTMDEKFVLLQIRQKIWAAFECDGEKRYFGNYDNSTEPNIPLFISKNIKTE